MAHDWVFRPRGALPATSASPPATPSSTGSALTDGWFGFLATSPGTDEVPFPKCY